MSTQTCPMKQFLVPLTSAISNDWPTAKEVQMTKAMHLVLMANKVFESNCDRIHRNKILRKLTELFRHWIRTIATAKRVSEEDAANLGGLILPFGSYGLGVHQSGSDLDALCVAPRYIEREEFFATFYPLLKNQTEVSNCRAVEPAFVPVIKMKFDGLEVDLVFARLLYTQIPDDLDLSADNILANLDERCVRSLNGRRVSHAILQLVPKINVFRVASRAIKLWAKRTGVYSNTLGYFGGITWALLVARTCQLYPQATAATIVHKTFQIFSQWHWSTPMLLSRVDNVADLAFPAWDSRINAADRCHLMSIITPAYPQQNSSYNVTRSSKKVIMIELLRGFNKTKDIMEGRATWETLFEGPNFFATYRHFVMLEVNSKTAADHAEWFGLIESKLRLLISNIENAPHVTMAHLNPRSFAAKKCEWAAFSSMWFIGLEFDRKENLTVDLTAPITRFVAHIFQFAESIRMLRPGMTINAVYVKRRQLKKYLDEDVLNLRREETTNVDKENKDPSEDDTRVGKRPSDAEIYNPLKLAKHET